MLECDCQGEVSGCFRLHSKNLAASAGVCGGVRSMSNSKRYLYRRTLWNQKRAGEQNAAETDVLRPGVQFLVGKLERDRQVQSIASVASLGPRKGIHGGHGCYERVRRSPCHRQVTLVHRALSRRPMFGRVICYRNPALYTHWELATPVDACNRDFAYRTPVFRDVSPTTEASDSPGCCPVWQTCIFTSSRQLIGNLTLRRVNRLGPVVCSIASR
jgi:hypothetical protein